MTATGPASNLAKVELEHVCSYWATLTPPEVIGPVAEGIRANFYVTSGEVSGPKMQGRLRPVGGDWLLVRTDGVGVLDVRATMELDTELSFIRRMVACSISDRTATTSFCRESSLPGSICESSRGTTLVIQTTCGSTGCSV